MDKPLSSTILVVEDSLSMRAALLTILNSAEYTTLAASSGEEALSQVTNKQVDLILLDINLPGISGYDTCRQIKAMAKFSEIPIIFVSTDTDERSRITVFKSGAVDFINKPISQLEVLMRVKLHLKQYLQHRKLNQINNQSAQKAHELELINTTMLEREMIIIRMKEQINELSAKLGKTLLYPSV